MSKEDILLKHLYESDRVEEFRWVETDGGVKVVGYRGTKNYVCIPSEIDGKPVVALGNEPFNYQGQEYHVLFPATLERIDPGVFIPKSSYYSSVRSWFCGFEIPEDNPYMKEEGQLLLSRDGKTLMHCFDFSSLEITIPEGITTIAQEAFRNCNVKKIHFPSTLEAIEDRAFAGCEFQPGIYGTAMLPEGLKTVGYNLCAYNPDRSWNKPVKTIQNFCLLKISRKLPVHLLLLLIPFMKLGHWATCHEQIRFHCLQIKGEFL